MDRENCVSPDTKYQVAVDLYKDSIQLSWNLFRTFLFMQAVLLALFGALAGKDLFGFIMIIAIIGISISIVCLWVPRRFQKYVDASLKSSKRFEDADGPMSDIEKIWHENDVQDYHIYSVVGTFVKILIFIWVCIFLYAIRAGFCNIVSCT